jgi:hypothetical protein
MQFWMLFHLPFINLWSDQYSLGLCEITPKNGYFGEWEVKEHLKLHNLRIYNIVIWSELKFLTGAKVLSSRKWGSVVCKTRPKNRRFGAARFFDGVKPVANTSLMLHLSPFHTLWTTVMISWAAEVSNLTPDWPAFFCNLWICVTCRKRLENLT